MKKYDNYKDSGIEWIGEIPEHWSVKKLKFFANVVLGKMLTSEDKGDYFLRKYLRAKNIEWNNPNVEDVKEMWFSPKELITFRIKKGDLLVSEGGEVGRTCVWNNDLEECYIQNSVHKVTVAQNGNPHYFLNQFVLFGVLGHFDAIVNKISIAHLTKEKLSDISFIFPPFEEQTQIANYLDHKTTQIDTLIAKKEQFISLLQEERTALINQAVTKGLDPKVKMKDSGIEWLGEIPEHWEVTRLGFLSSKIGDGLHGTPNYVDDSDFKFINGNNIGDGQISIYEHTKCVSEEEYLSNKKELSENSILMSINGTIGNLGFYKGEKVMLGKSVAYINIIDYKTLNFTYKYLESESCKTYIDNQLSGSTIKNLSLYSINKIPIPFPSFDEQKDIVDYITIKTNEINVLITKSQQEIELLKEYKTALISEVVTGKVDVRDEVLN